MDEKKPSFIESKKDNVLYGSFPAPDEGERGEDSGPDGYYEPDRQSSPSEMWAGYGAVICFTALFSFATYMNMQGTNKDSGRGLASSSKTRAWKKDARILEDLKSGKRDLASVDNPYELKKEYFTAQVLEGYKVSFDSKKGWVLGIVLKPEAAPSFIPDVEQFIKEHKEFFPKGMGKALESKEGAVKIESYDSKDYRFIFRLNESHSLLSLAVEDKQ